MKTPAAKRRAVSPVFRGRNMRCPASVYDSAPEPANGSGKAWSARKSVVESGKSGYTQEARSPFQTLTQGHGASSIKEGIVMRKLAFAAFIALVLVLLLASDAR